MESKEYIMKRIKIILRQFKENDRKQDAEHVEFKKKIRLISEKIRNNRIKKKQKKMLYDKKKIINDYLYLQYIGRQWEKNKQKELSYLYNQYNYVNSGNNSHL